eukprot:jgi/Mesvir1/15666/Mv03267-RA.1
MSTLEEMKRHLLSQEDAPPDSQVNTAYNSDQRILDGFKLNCNVRKREGHGFFKNLARYLGGWSPLAAYRNTTAKQLLDRMVRRLLPAYSWMSTYDVKEYLKGDVIAGLSVGVMLIPQSLAYAGIAELPSRYGMYAGLAPLFVYGLFGGCRQLSVGPAALVALLLEQGLGDIVDPAVNLPAYVQLAICTATLVGVFQFMAGVLRLGFLVNFLSHSVVSGFTSGAAIIIALSQVKHILGYEIPRDDILQNMIVNILRNIGQINWPTFIMGVIWFVILYTMKRLGSSRRGLHYMAVMGPLTVSVLGISVIAVTGWDLPPFSIKIVGFIDAGLPPLSFDQWNMTMFRAAAGTALTVMSIGFMESIAISKSLAARNKYRLNANQELMALGLSNLVGSAFSSFPVTGSFSRSALNNNSGARTGLASMITASLIMATLLFLTPFFQNMPKNVLGAIVIFAVLGLVDISEAVFLWKSSKRDLCLWLCAFNGTMFLGVEEGIFVAILISLGCAIYDVAYPHTAVLGQLPGTRVFRDVEQFTEAIVFDGVLCVRFDAALSFTNVNYFEERLHSLQFHESTSPPPGGELVVVPAGQRLPPSHLKFIVLDLAAVSSVDASGFHTLKSLIDEYSRRDIQLCLANPSRHAMSRLEHGGVLDVLGREWLFLSVHDAVRRCVALLRGGAAATTTTTIKADETSLVIVQGGGHALTRGDAPSGAVKP